jgi:exopolysaccharide biosynthesis polyprenyl glycosylphosphotransferase
VPVAEDPDSLAVRLRHHVSRRARWGSANPDQASAADIPGVTNRSLLDRDHLGRPPTPAPERGPGSLALERTQLLAPAAGLGPTDGSVGSERLTGARRPRLRRGRNLILAGADLAALALALGATRIICERIARPALSAPSWLMVLLIGLAAPVCLAVFTAYRLYDQDAVRISVSSFDDVRAIFHALLVVGLGFSLGARALDSFTDWRLYSALQVSIFISCALVLVPLGRCATRRFLLPRVTARRRVLIVGNGSGARLLRQKLSARRELGLDVVGVLNRHGQPEPGPVPVLGACKDIARVVEAYAIDVVLLASSIGRHEEMLDLVRSVRRPEVQISILPRYFEVFTSRAILDDVEGMPVVTLPRMRLGAGARLLKRAFDLVVTSLALVVAAPLIGAIVIAIRLDSPGPAFFRQPRRGRGGCAFQILKFRTMYQHAERQRIDLVHLNQVDGPLFKIKGRDPRVTRLGAFLRRTSLDELPQLWNVLRGQMSLIGPRPFVTYEADQITGWASRRLDMPPGITGLWQVLGRNDLPFEEMVKLDYLYVTNWSLWWDIKILCQTVPVVLRRRGAY